MYGIGSIRCGVVRTTSEGKGLLDTEKSAMDGAVKGIEGWVSCFEKSELKGIVYGVGVDAVGTVKGTPAIEEAYKMGKAV